MSDLLNFFLFFSYHHTIKVEWLLLSMPQEIWALLHQWEMSLRGGPADTLLPVSGAPEPGSKGEQDGAGRGLCRTGKSELIKPSASTETPGPTPATCSGLLPQLLMEKLTHIGGSRFACRQGRVLCCLRQARLFLSSVENVFFSFIMVLFFLIIVYIQFIFC